MINKVVGYGGFRSYQENPYPTKKQGKQLEETNQIWAQTKKQSDKINPLDNFNHYHTMYKKSHVQVTEPKDYHPQHVVKGAHRTLDFKANSLGKPYDVKECQKAGEPEFRKSISMLKTGAQHWQTNYQSSICNPVVDHKMNTTNKTSKFSTMRSNSMGNVANKNLIDEKTSKEQSYKNRAYINDTKTGTTDYKFNFGEKIGANPLQILSRDGCAQPLRDHPLKKGTNQLWTEIPGYQGFKPAEVPFEELKSKIVERKLQEKGDRKVNLVQNYNVQIPGYAGYRPKYNIATNQLRDSCFSTK